ncbi:unnamed protein product [Absidia cylindrospora]
MDRLPPELLPAITSHLDYRHHYQVALVNKAFYAAMNPRIWHYLYLNYDEPFGPFCNRIASSPHGVGAHVRVLDTSFQWTDATVLALIKHLPHLDTLKIMNGQGITDESFAWLGYYCPSLTTLQLRDSRITQVTMESLGNHCKHLTHLTLGECPHLRSDMFSALVACPLEDIDIYECDLKPIHSNRPAAAAAMQQQGMVDLLKQHGLKKLRFSQTRSFPLPSLCITAWPQMVSLNLDTDQALNEPDAIAFLRAHATTLVDLSLDGGGLSDTFLDAIITYAAKTIDAVGLHGQPLITAQAIRRLIIACPNLGLVSMYDCGIVGRDFPETAPFSIYDGDDFDMHPINSLWDDEMVSIRKARGNDTQQ